MVRDVCHRVARPNLAANNLPGAKRQRVNMVESSTCCRQTILSATTQLRYLNIVPLRFLLRAKTKYSVPECDNEHNESNVQRRGIGALPRSALFHSVHNLPLSAHPMSFMHAHTPDHFGRAFAALRCGNCRAVKQHDQSRARAS